MEPVERIHCPSQHNISATIKQLIVKVVNEIWWTTGVIVLSIQPRMKISYGNWTTLMDIVVGRPTAVIMITADSSDDSSSNTDRPVEGRDVYKRQSQSDNVLSTINLTLQCFVRTFNCSVQFIQFVDFKNNIIRVF